MPNKNRMKYIKWKLDISMNRKLQNIFYHGKQQRFIFAKKIQNIMNFKWEFTKGSTEEFE